MSHLSVVSSNGTPIDRPAPLVYTKESAWKTAHSEEPVVPRLAWVTVAAAFVAAMILGPYIS